MNSERKFFFSIDADWMPGSQLGLKRLYQLCSAFHLPAAVFVAGRFALEYPDLLHEGVALRHEIGTHGWEHGQDPSEDFQGTPYERQRAWLERSSDAFERVMGVRPTAFRAPNLHIDETTFRVLKDLSYTVDSSVPSRRFDFGYGQVSSLRHYNAPLFPYHPSEENIAREGSSPILEIPPSAFWIPMNMSALRMVGLAPLRWAVRRLAERTSVLTFYCHPMEFEVAEKQSVVASTPARYRAGLGPANVELLSRFIEYVLERGFRPASLTDVRRSGRRRAA